MTKLKRQSGFTIVELLVTMVIFVVVMAAASNIFVGLLTNFKQQSRLAETSIEGMVGLKMFKADVELAGYGLPFDLNGAIYVDEAVNDTSTTHNEMMFNDAPNVPRAILAAAGGYNGSDIFTVKGSVYGMNGTTQKWAYMTNVGGAVQLRTWKDPADSDIKEENLQSGDNVLVVRPVLGERQMLLINTSTKFYTTFGSWTNFAPQDDTETYLIYGLTGKTNPPTIPRMPFNRADFYVRRPAGAGEMPSQCQGSTPATQVANSPGILYKAVVTNKTTGVGAGETTEYALLDCVAAMKMVMMVDMDEDNTTPPTAAPAGAWPTVATTAEEIRDQLKEIRIYILAQEGSRDPNYQSPLEIDLTDPDAGPLLTYVVPDRNYRWKIYTMVIKPYNLR